MQTSTGRPNHLTSPTPFLNAGRKLFRLMIRIRARSSLDVIVFNRCPRSPCVRLMLPRTRCKTVDCTPWHPSETRHLLPTDPKPGNRTIFSVITGRILVGRIVTMVWDLQQQLAAECDQHKRATLPITPEKEGWPGLDKSNGQSKRFLRGSREVC